MAGRNVVGAAAGATPPPADPEEERKIQTVREALDSLYGAEEKLIVTNEFEGVVCIGFGKRGDEGGHNLERSKLPQVLTDLFPREMWLQSSDFRQALAKGRLRLIPLAEYDRLMRQAQSREQTLARLAALDRGKTPRKFDGVTNAPDGEDQVPMDIDETTSSLVEVTEGPDGTPMSEIQRGMDAYDTGDNPPAPLRPPTPIQAAGHSAKAESLVERTIRGAVKPMEALRELDGDRSMYTRDDLEYIAARAAYDGVKVHARTLLKQAA